MKLNENLINAILQYLAKQPYEQVAGLIAGISKEIELNKQDKLTIADE
jgi:hypothetical protein